ncbi:MAG: hypothetical protein Q8Q15_01100 [bacterium]|nr:hypothetical protein [bacterium]
MERKTFRQTWEQLTHPVLVTDCYEKQMLAFRKTFPEYITPERLSRLERSYLLNPLSFCRFFRENVEKSWPKAILMSPAVGYLHKKEENKIYDNSPTILVEAGILTLGWAAAKIILSSGSIPSFAEGAIMVTADIALIAAINARRYHEVCHALSFQDPGEKTSGIAKTVVRKGVSVVENKNFNEVLTDKFAEMAMKRDGITPWISSFGEKLLLYHKSRWIWFRQVEATLVHFYDVEEKERLVSEAYWDGKLKELIFAFNQSLTRGQKTFEELSKKAG